MVTARLAIGSVSAVAVAALLLGSAPYWMHRVGAGATAAPWGVIQSFETTHAEAAPSVDRDQLLKLAALKSGGAAEVQTAVATAPVPPEPAPQPDVAPAQQAVAAPEASASAMPQANASGHEPQQLASVESPAAADAQPAGDADKTDRININTASSSALDHLPGAGRIGHAIISHRPYKTTKDLVSRRILRMSDFQKIQSRISVD